MDPKAFFEEFVDLAGPHLDCYEQAVYLFIIRHSRLIGLSDVVIGFKSARRLISKGIGEAGKPMSESTCSEKIASLAQKGFVRVLDSTNKGTRIHAFLPSEVRRLQKIASPAIAVSIEELDFFERPELRKSIIERENNRCFYCLALLSMENHIIEHVRSRPEGDNSYRNVVASCRACNNRKGQLRAEDFVRTLYREAILSQDECATRLVALGQLLAGELKPVAP